MNILFLWDGHVMIPHDHFSRLAQSSFTSGHAYRMIVADERRSLDQNKRLWAMLNEFSAQVEHHGHHWAPEDWKAILLYAFQKEIRLLPGLDGSIVWVGQSTSALSKAEMSEFLEFIIAEGVQRGVIFHDGVASEYPPDRKAG